jgi:hypothetical protein
MVRVTRPALNTRAIIVAHFGADQAKIDRAYEDRLSGHVSDDLWHRKTQQWEQELADIRRDTALHESASHDYAARGSKILELAQTAPAQFVTQNPAEQARMLKMLLSNCTFDRGSLSVAWVKPFDLLARGNENGDWLGGRESPGPLCRALLWFASGCQRPPFQPFGRIQGLLSVCRLLPPVVVVAG